MLAQLRLLLALGVVHAFSSVDMSIDDPSVDPNFVAGVDLDGSLVNIFGNPGFALTCAFCMQGNETVPSPCLGIVWPPENPVSTCGHGYSYLCPETCLAIDPATFMATPWYNADYSKNNNAVTTSKTISGLPGFTCEEMEVITDDEMVANGGKADGNHQLNFFQCTKQSLAGILCVESCHKMFDLESCDADDGSMTAQDSTTFTDAQAGGTCAQWNAVCSKQNTQHASINFESYIDDCANFNTADNWAFDDPSHECEVGGYIGSMTQISATGFAPAKYYTKANMDEVRANCPVACYTCHDA